METVNSSTGYVGAYSSSNDALTGVAAYGICDLRRDIAKAESDLRETIHNQSLVQGTEFCAVNKSIHEAECNVIKNDNDIAHRNTIHLNSVERDLQNRILENRQVLTSIIGDKTDRVLDRIDREAIDLKNQLRAFEMSNAEKFCELKTEGFKNTQKILDELAKNKYDAIKDELDETRLSKYHDKSGYQFALQNQEIASLKQMINSVEQNQKFSSKTVQFGTGNLAGTAQTANQG